MKEPFPSQNKFTGCVLFQATAKYTLSKGSEPERVKERKLNTGEKKNSLVVPLTKMEPPSRTTQVKEVPNGCGERRPGHSPWPVHTAAC